MKRIAYLLLCVGLVTTLFTSCSKSGGDDPKMDNSARTEVKWDDISTTYTAAKKSDKDLLVFFHADWCGVCQDSKKNTFKEASLIKTTNKHLITMGVLTNTYDDKTLKLNGKDVSPNEMYKELTGEESIPAMPTFVLVKKDGTHKIVPGAYPNDATWTNVITKTWGYPAAE